MNQDCAPNFKVDMNKVQDAVPKDEPYSKRANPTKYRVLGHTYYVRKTAVGYDETGIASWYGMKFHAHKTSTGEMYDVTKMTAASKELPLPCYVKVTNLKNGKQVVVKVNDRGPFHENRIIDLSYVAAHKLGIWPKGTGLVRVQGIDARTWRGQTVTTVPVKGRPQIYMQIGAFRIRSNAEGLVVRIQKITSDQIQIKTVQLDGSPIYKVQIGPLASVDKSDSLYAALEREKLGTPMTVVQ
jgi:rare lipoprotein A